MRSLLTAAIGVFLASPAMAQQPGDFTLWPDVIADSGLAGYTGNGVGAPTVAYDSTRDRYLMVFETRLDSPTNPGASCPVGTWGLGIATSPDGVSNWVGGPRPLLEPTSGTFYACVAAHPTALYDATSDQLFVFFKAEDEGTSATDLSRYEGIGRIRVRFRANGSIKSVLKDSVPVANGAGVAGADLGFPRVIHDGGEFVMALTIRPNTYIARSSATTGFSLDPLPALTVSDFAAAGWANNELFNPALLCDEGAFKYTLFQGGRTILGGVIASAGWSRAISSDATTWFESVDPFYQWSGGDSWRHWDALRVGTSDYLVWFAEKDANGKPRVRLTSTVSNWNNADVYSKQCP